MQFFPFSFRISEKSFAQALPDALRRKLARATGSTEVDYRENKFADVYDFSPAPGETHFCASPAPTGREEPWARPPTVEFQCDGSVTFQNVDFPREEVGAP